MATNVQTCLSHDPLDMMTDWENGALSDEETVDLFQHLIDTGLAWQLQGCYGRTARDLIDSHECHAAK